MNEMNKKKYTGIILKTEDRCKVENFPFFVTHVMQEWPYLTSKLPYIKVVFEEEKILNNCLGIFTFQKKLFETCTIEMGSANNFCAVDLSKNYFAFHICILSWKSHL